VRVDGDEMPSADTELMRQGMAGDTAAFWQLAHRHRAMVYRIARGIVRTPEDAEDVVQEVFLSAYRALDQFDLRREPAAWLRAIAVNRSITACRQRSRAWTLVDSSSAVEAVSRLGVPEEHAEEADMRARLSEALVSLSPRQRAVVTLSGLDGLTPEQIAEAMGCRVGTVKTHLHRARERLAHLLADHLREV
jgi:RNA polymerase sigma-70 factor, ECF subfamily